MTLKTDMAADLASVFLNSDEFADSGEYYPRGNAQHFTVKLVMGDLTTSDQTLDSGIVEGDRTCQATLIRSVVRAGLLAALGTARDPIRDDRVVIATGEQAGTWCVAGPAQTDVGGGITVTLVRDTLDQVAGHASVEVR